MDQQQQTVPMEELAQVVFQKDIQIATLIKQLKDVQIQLQQKDIRIVELEAQLKECSKPKEVERVQVSS